MLLSLIFFMIGILGFVISRKNLNLILMLISIEIMLLAVTFLILVSSVSFDNTLNHTYTIYVVASTELVTCLCMSLAFYRLKINIAIDYKITYLATIVLSLLGSIVFGFFGIKVGVIGAHLVTSLSVVDTTILAESLANISSWVGVSAISFVVLNMLLAKLGICLLIGAMVKSSQIDISFLFEPVYFFKSRFVPNFRNGLLLRSNLKPKVNISLIIRETCLLFLMILYWFLTFLFLVVLL